MRVIHIARANHGDSVLAKRISGYLKKITGETILIEHLPPRPGETKELSYDYEKIEKDLGARVGFTLNKNRAP